MAIPAFISQGTGVNVRTTCTTAVTWPADVSVSDLAILVMATVSNTTTLTTGSVINWTTLMPNTSILNSGGWMQVLYRVCAGTEDGLNNITMVAVGTATGTREAAQVYTFRGTPGATWKFDTGGGASFVNVSNASSTQFGDLGVSVSGNNRLLTNFAVLGQHNETVTLTGGTGATWQPSQIYSSGNNPSFAMFYASLTSSGSISGATSNVLSLACQTFIVGTGIWESIPITPLTVTPTGYGLSPGKGDSGAVIPSGF